jgi:hypothetical protein
MGESTSLTGPGRRRRRHTVGIVVALVVVVVLVVGVVIADGALRAYAQDRATAEIESSLPDTVDGDIDVRIGGFSFLQQYLSGSFDRVTIDGPALTAAGVPVDARVVARGVPTDLTRPVDSLLATLTLDQDAVNSVMEVPGAATLTLDDQAVGYDGSLTFLGLSLDYRVAAAVSVTADSVVLAPQKATLTAGSAVVDASEALDAVLDESIPICVANHLPQGVELADLRIADQTATVTLQASRFTIDSSSLGTLGVCP